MQVDSIEPGGSEMAVSRAQQKAVNKYVKENYDRINVTMPKGKKDEIQAHAVCLVHLLSAIIVSVL